MSRVFYCQEINTRFTMHAARRPGGSASGKMARRTNSYVKEQGKYSCESHFHWNSADNHDVHRILISTSEDQAHGLYGIETKMDTTRSGRYGGARS